jgi:hypothetical protein
VGARLGSWSEFLTTSLLRLMDGVKDKTLNLRVQKQFVG